MPHNTCLLRADGEDSCAYLYYYAYLPPATTPYARRTYREGGGATAPAWPTYLPPPGGKGISRTRGMCA